MTDDWSAYRADEPLEPGQLRLYDDVRPGLPAGDYDIDVETRLVPGGKGVGLPIELPAAVAPRATWSVTVGSPRFGLLPSAVQRLAPAPGTADASPLELPHAVLRRATLPWERSAGSGLPWLAVVVLTDDELSRCSLAVVPTADAAALTVRGGREDGDPPETEVLGVPSALVASVFPRAGDLPLLCHGRETAPGDIALAAGDDDSLFAVVIANRVPPAATRCSAFLLSLEARLDELTRIAAGSHPAPPAPRADGPRPAITPGDVVFAVHARWSFGTSAAGGDFTSVVTGLDTGLLGTQRGDPGRAAAVAPTGHVSLQARSRSGDPHEAWYRGPASPFPTRHQAPEAPAAHADTLRTTAPDGRPDISYAAAFEIGRLLALSDPMFVLALRRWACNGFRLSTSFQLGPWLPPQLDPDAAASTLPYAVPGLPVGREGGALGALGPLLPTRGLLVIPGRGGSGPLVNPAPEALGGALEGLGPDLPDLIELIRGGPVSQRPGTGLPGGGPVIGGPGDTVGTGRPGLPGGHTIPGFPGGGLRPGRGLTFDDALARLGTEHESLRADFAELATRVDREIHSLSPPAADALRDHLTRRPRSDEGPGRTSQGEWPP